MASKSGQLINLLGFDLVDSALASLTELWEQHISTIQNIVIKDFLPDVKGEDDECGEPEFYHVERVQTNSTPTEKKISPHPHPLPPPPPITVSNTDQNIPDVPQDSEWSTEDESFESIESIGDETYQRMTGKRSSNSSHKLSTIKKQKRKQTEYFTPSIPRKSKRVTRATATKVDNTPKSISRNNLMVKASSSVSKSSNQMMLSVEKPIGTTISGSSIASSVGASSSVSQTDSVKGKRTIARATATRITRATANKVEETPKIVSPTKSNLLALASSSISKSGNKLMLSAEKSNGATTSGSSIASSVTTVSSICRTDSIKGKRTVARTCKTPDTKSLTASAAKKRLEEEEKRKAALALMKEKEEKALQTKQENLKMKVAQTKMKNEEKRKKIGQIKKKEEEELQEKRQKEQSKLEEIEKRQREKEEARRREMMRNQEAAKRKQIEFDLRKQQEEIDRKARLLKQEEQNRQKKEESERIQKEKEKILRMIAQHNINFQKGQNTSATQQKVDPPAATVSQFKQPLPPTNEAQPALLMNKTFDKVEVKKETPPPPPPPAQVKVESYQITPPPKPKPAPVNYDISDIKSDDDTDDEERPKKLIPAWAKGDALIAALDKQFAKSRRARERQIREIFPNYDFSIQLADIFKSSSRIVHPKYDKRTSSAVWSSPPCNSTLNCSSMLSDGY